MIYRNFKGKQLPFLGLGCMRLPVIDNDENNIDMDKAKEMVSYAMKHGVNYFDTAWGYHGGNSEEAMGIILKEYPRDSYYVASKFPGYDLSNMDKVEEIFEQQLAKTGMKYFDFYMLHNVCELNVKQYLDDEKYGIMSYLLRQKELGRIKHLGFSTHGRLRTMRKFLDAVGQHMEFCQIQLNWLDWDFQKASEKVKLLSKRNIPIFVMEPLRGGRLAVLPKDKDIILKELRPDEPTAAWGFRFLQGIDNVALVLSGMSNMEQLKENIEITSVSRPLSDRETMVLLYTATGLIDPIPCTACRYCTTHCPQGLDIPTLLSLYNEHKTTENGFIAPMAVASLPDDKKPSSCLGCKACNDVCPQKIQISEALADFAAKIK
ncbi:MAG: aldo/keto reductase [Firmicutes bacterium]|nr:aldo/keto reductase [Bacillota bacterium]